MAILKNLPVRRDDLLRIFVPKPSAGTIPQEQMIFEESVEAEIRGSVGTPEWSAKVAPFVRVRKSLPAL